MTMRASPALALLGVLSAGCGLPKPTAPVELDQETLAERPRVEPGPGVVRVHLESPDPELELRGFGAATLRPAGDGGLRALDASGVLCKAPCGDAIDARHGQPLVVSGPVTPESSPFVVGELQGDILVTAEPGSKALLTTGMVLAAVGGVGMLAGSGVAVVGLITKSGEVTQTPDELLLGGGIALGASAVVVGVGLVLRYVGTTFVTIEPVAPAKAATGPRLLPNGFAW